MPNGDLPFDRSCIATSFCIAFTLTGCGKPQQIQRAPPAHDPTADAWYQKATTELAELDANAKRLYAAGKPDPASALIEQGETIAARLLAVPRPTLAATEAASDLDELYGRMLFANRHYGWARLQFQKNVARWKRWKPASPDTTRRLKSAQDAIDDCDKKIEKSL